MVNPIDLQTMIVRGIDVSTSVSQQANVQTALAQLVNAQMIQRSVQHSRTVTPREGVEQKNVGSSTEERSSSAFYRPSSRRGTPAREEVREESKGTILDVRL
ncbi:hypothetical protein [Thermotoga caldifontis]|uniref:hypothetical protein n=1 Tax=Thermotoga caldifontis TaxID=1508419 RepID=UPI0005979661|nr:hypothetical protein [Thermotoga caldifontis]